MGARLGKLRSSLALLLATSIAVSGYEELAQAGRCTQVSSSEVATSCSATACGCSQGTNEPTPCCCCVKEAPAPQAPSSGANKSPADLKLAHWMQSVLAAASLTTSDRSPSVSVARHFSPLRPSVRLLHCVWRI